jgi:hypothetical protein
MQQSHGVRSTGHPEQNPIAIGQQGLAENDLTDLMFEGMQHSCSFSSNP